MNTRDPKTPRVKAVKNILMGIVLAAAVVVPHRMLTAAGPAPVVLGETAHFTILAGAAITTTGGGIINGDVGASPIAGSAIGIPAAQVNGIIYAVDASGPAGSVVDPVMLTAAKGDLTTAYNDAAGRTPVPTGPFLNPNGGNIGGLNLVPGLYKFTSTAYITGSDVTLTGGPDDVWIFQCAADLQLGSGIKVILAGGARAKNVFWQVGTSATLGTSSSFKGTIMADQAVTMNTSSTMEGRALAFSAGVTFNGTGGSLPKESQVITNFVPVSGSEFEGTNKVGLSAQATSLLPVSFAVGNGPGIITGGTNLVFTATGLVSVVASQSGNVFYDPAPNKTNTYRVLPADKQDQTITNFVPASGSEFEGTNKVGLSAQATSLLPVSFAVGNGPGIITGGTNLVFTATGMVSIVASQAGSMFYNAAPNVTNTYGVLLADKQDQTITNFMPVSGSAFEGTSKVGLSAEATSLLPVSFAVGNGPGIITGGTNLVFTATGMVSVVASQAGSMFYNAAPDVINTYEVLPAAEKLDQEITDFMPADGSVFSRSSKVGLSAVASSLLPVSFTVGSGPGIIAGGTNLVFTSVGQVSIVASQAGSMFYNAAPDVTHTYTVGSSVFCDYTGNDVTDMAVYGLATGNWYIRDAQGNVIVAAKPFGGADFRPVPGDYSGDGVNDFAVYCAANGGWYIMTLNGDIVIYGEQFGGEGYSPVPGDYDGDGIYDLAVYEQSSGTWYIRGIDGKVLAWAEPWGGLTFMPVPGDYNGDGIYDLAVYEQATGLWYIRTFDGTVLAWAQPWGGPGFAHVSGDFDGDGIHDMAVYEQASGAWYIRGMNATTILWGEQFGGSVFAALSGDYDGDGTDDLAAYDIPNGLWYVRSIDSRIILWAESWGGPGYMPVSEADASFKPADLRGAHRFYNYGYADAPDTLKHLFTIDTAEAAYISGLPSWVYEGIVWYALPAQSGDAVALYRLYYAANETHYWTTDAASRNTLLSAGWQDQGVSMYVWTTASGGRRPVYRFYSAGLDKYVFTAVENGRDYLLSTSDWPFGYVYQGIAFYVYDMP